MRSSERDVLLFLLAVASGSADAWSYLGLGHAFVANMTGNTVLTGMAIFQKNGNVIHPLIALVCYAVGATTASFIARKVPRGVMWARAITLTLLLEAVIMAVAEAGWIVVHTHSVPDTGAVSPLTILLGCVAFAIGLQSGAMLRLSIPGIVTTYITGTWTNLMSGLVQFAAQGKNESPKQRLQFEERLLMQGGILAVYFGAAVLTGWLFGHAPLIMGVLSAGAVLLVAVYAAARSGSTGKSVGLVE